MTPRSRSRSPGARRAPACIDLALLLLGAAVVVAGPAGAATFTVTTTTDGGAGSLRDAFAQASANAEADEIVLQAGATYVLDDCGEGDLDHTGASALAIVGNGATIRQSCAGERVIETSAPLTVTDATVTGGDLPAGLGGGIEADTSNVALVRSTVSGNTGSTGGGIGAIRVTMVDSTVSGNSAATGGGIWVDQTLSATNSTITANTASTSGGGVAVVNTSITLLYATVAANSSPLGANLQVQPGGDQLVSFASVVSSPAGGGANCDIDDGASTTSQGFNYSTDGSCGFGAGAGDVAGGGDPLLGALGANGGSTATRVPAAGSPLLDKVTCGAAPSAVSADQRGVSRPQGSACDIGAVEVVVTAPTATTAAPSSPGSTPSGGGAQGGAPIRFSG